MTGTLVGLAFFWLVRDSRHQGHDVDCRWRVISRHQRTISCVKASVLLANFMRKRPLPSTMRESHLTE
jgi:hypothetical protein